MWSPGCPRASYFNIFRQALAHERAPRVIPAGRIFCGLPSEALRPAHRQRKVTQALAGGLPSAFDGCCRAGYKEAMKHFGAWVRRRGACRTGNKKALADSRKG